MKPLKFVFLLSLVLFPFISVVGQINEITVTFSENNKPLYEVLLELESKHSIRFYFNKNDIKDISVPSSLNHSNLKTVLTQLLPKYNLNFAKDKQGNIFISKGEYNMVVETIIDDVQLVESDYTNNIPTEEADNEDDISLSSLKNKVIIGKPNNSTKRFSNIIGLIKDVETGEIIVGATVYIEELKTGTVTDEKGYYMINLKKGTYTFTFKALGMKTVQKNVTIHSDGRLNIEMSKELIALNEVIVKDDRYSNLRGVHTGYEQITLKEIKELPPMAGERDVLKASLMLPGVQSVGESAAGYNIRGGEADQNLFLINQVPIYNTSHMFGFFSSFNSDIIRNFSLFKSGIPIKYGGRVSSVFDIQTKQGNEKKFSLKGGISPITARLSVEGPIVKDKSSYIVGARGTYSNWILKHIENPEIRNSNIYFYDFVANTNYKISNNDNISLFAYYSLDNYHLPTDINYNYYNIGSSISWHHFFGERFASDLSLVFSNYHLQRIDKQNVGNEYVFDHDLKHLELKHNFSFTPTPKHEIVFGYSSILYMLEPASFVPENSQSGYQQLIIEKESANESAIYIGDHYEINSKLQAQFAVRYSYFNYLGPKTIINYNAGESPSDENVVDTSYYNNLKSVKTYAGLDIRASLRYLINQSNSFKLAYSKINQYLFLLTNTVAISPTDRWKLCDNYIPPITGEQYNFGFYHNFSKSNYEASVELYYKNTYNIKDFRNGADLLKNEFPERDILSGFGRSYGVEFMLKKGHGRVSGWLNYTYSRSEQQFDSENINDRIDNGEFYPANTDKPHNFNITLNYKSNRRLSIATNFTYSTGRPGTFPVSKAIPDLYNPDQMYINYEKRNRQRIPDYIRLDVAVNLEGNLLRKKLAHSYWTFSVYNLLGRKNAYSVFFTNENGALKGHKISIFPNPIFTVSYNFKLGNYMSD